MGGGSVIQTLRDDFGYSKAITAVEIDPVIIELAQTEFGISEDEQLKIHCTDALKFVSESTSTFDLIIIDLFIDLSVPDQFLSESFWKDILRLKSANGAVIFNAAVKEAKQKTIQQLISYLKTKVYLVDVHESVNNTNTLLILKSL